MKAGRRGLEKIIRLKSAALEVQFGHIAASEDLRELAAAVLAIYDGQDPRVALGLVSATPGNVPHPERVLMQRYEVRDAIITRMMERGMPAKAACEAIAAEAVQFTDPLNHDAYPHRKPLSAKSLERIWKESTTSADRELLKRAASMQKGLTNSKK